MSSKPTAETAVKRLLIDTEDGQNLSIKLLNLNRYTHDDSEHNGATLRDLDLVRDFPQRKYSERTAAWEVPVTEPNVSFLLQHWTLEQLLVTDGAQLLLDYHSKTSAVADLKLAERLEYLQGGAVKTPPDYQYATPPYPHQTIAFSSGRTQEYFGLLMEMGTGKSKVLIDIICDRARRKRAKDPTAQFKVLIVAPKTITHNWLLELEKHATVDMSAERLKGGKLKRLNRLLELIQDKSSPVQVAIINYEGLDIMLDALKMVPWDLMALDESICIKSTSAKRTKAAIAIGQNARSRFILTGLPITKNVTDLYSQFNFLKEGCLGYTSKYAFENEYAQDDAKFKTKLPQLQKQLSRFSFVIKRSQCLDLPPKMYQTREIELGDEQAAAYDQMLQDSIVSLETLDAKTAKKLEDEPLITEMADQLLGLSAAQNPGQFSLARIIIVQMLRLAQITSGHLKMADGSIKTFSPNPKLEAIDGLLEEIDDADKVIVWSRFREDLRLLESHFKPKFPVASVHGGVADKQREDNIERFKSDPRCRLFIGNPASGGKGLNLTEANHVVYFANDFSLDNRLQSEDRAHRIGQKKTVLYYDLVAPNTVDQLVVDRLRRKRDLAELLTDKAKIIESLKAQLRARSSEE